MHSVSAARHLTCLFALAVFALLLAPDRAAAGPAELNLNISNNACGCTNLLDFPNGQLALSNSSESISVTFAFEPLQFFFCDALGDCQYSFGSGGSIRLVVNPGAANSVTYTDIFISAAEIVEPRGNDPLNPALSDISADGTFRLDGFSGEGNISAFDSAFNPAQMDQAEVTFGGTPTPEPSSLLLLATGLLGLLFWTAAALSAADGRRLDAVLVSILRPFTRLAPPAKF